MLTDTEPIATSPLSSAVHDQEGYPSTMMTLVQGNSETVRSNNQYNPDLSTVINLYWRSVALLVDLWVFLYRRIARGRNFDAKKKAH